MSGLSWIPTKKVEFLLKKLDSNLSLKKNSTLDPTLSKLKSNFEFIVKFSANKNILDHF